MNVGRKSIQLLLCVLCLLLAAAAVVRADDSTNQVRSTTETAHEQARQRRLKLPVAKGTLQDIDLLRRQLKLKTEDGVRTFTYTGRTYIFRDKQKITPDKLKVGEVIAVRFDTDKDGNHTVTRIKTDNPNPSAPAFLPNPAVSTNQPILDDSLDRGVSPPSTPPAATP
jgi:hypothetical protein